MLIGSIFFCFQFIEHEIYKRLRIGGSLFAGRITGILITRA